MNALQNINSGDVITIGRNFFSAAYIMVNYDTELFTMWPANPISNQDLVAVDSTGKERNRFCTNENGTATVTAAATASTNIDGKNTPSTSGQASASSPTPAGTIAAGVVGAVAGIVLLSIVPFYALKKHSAKKDRNLPIPTVELEADHNARGIKSQLHDDLVTDHKSVFLSGAGQPNSLYELATSDHGSPRYELPAAVDQK